VTQIAWWIRQSLQLSEILETIVAKVRQFLEADRVLIYRFQPDMSGTIVAESVLSGWTMALGCQIQDTCFQGNAGGHYHAGNKRAIADIYQADLTPCHLQLLEQFEVKANLVAPILLKDGLWGLLVIHQCSGVRHWQSFELDLLDQLVAQIAIAIQQATAYQQAQIELLKRRHIETTLRQSEQRYATLTEMSPVGIFQSDAAGHCLYVNERWCQIAGLRPDQAAGFGWIEGIHPDDREFVSAAWYAAAQANRPFRLEYRFQNAEGQITWAFGQAVAERDINGSIVGYVGTITDISDRKAAERALQVQSDFNERVAEITSRFVDLNPDALDAEIERTLQLIGEMIPVDTSYLIQFDQDTPTLSMTHEWSQPHCPRQTPLIQNLPLSIAPWSIGLLMQREVVQVSCVANLPAVAAIDQASYQQFNVVALLAVPLIQKSTVVGFIGFASFSQTMVWDEAMIRLLQVLAQTIANARQRAQAEQQIAESEERLRLALSAANQGLYDLNLQTGESLVSPEYATILGYDPATFRETNAQWIERLHPDDRDAVVSLYHDYVAGNLPDYEVEFRQRTRTGEWKWIFSKGKIVAWDEAGNPLRMLGTHTDISDRKQAEEQAQHRLDILEAARDIIASASSTGQVTYLNQAARELLGIDPDADILQTFIPDYHPPEIAELILQEALPQCAQQGFWAGETQFLRHDGSNFPAWQVIVAHRHQDGSISHFSTIARDITPLKQAEAERLQAENLRLELTLLENILDIILAGYWDWDIASNHEYLSPGFKQMLGYADHELPNSPESWQRLIFAEDLPGVLECFDRHVESRGAVPFNNEVRYRHKNGSTIWVICSGRVIEWNQAGQPIRMIGCHIDITDRKQAEQQLRKSDAHLKTAQRISNLGSWEFDLHTEQISWSDQVYCIFGRDPDAGPPSFEELQQYLHPDDRFPHQQAVQTAIETRQTYEIDFRIYRHDETLRYLQARGEPIADATGQLIQLVGTVLDISDRKQAQIALEESQRLLQTVLDSFPLAVFWKDRQSVILGCNQFFAKASGMTSPLEMIGKDAFDLPYSEEEALKYHEDDRAVMESGLSQIGIQETITLPNGQVQWVETNKIPLRNTLGEVVGIVGTFQDITDRKLAEEALAESEAFNRQLVTEFPIGLAICRMDGQLVHVNSAYAKILGRTIEETLALSYWDITPIKYAEQEAEQLRSLQQHGRYGSYEKEYIHKDGHLVPVLLTGLILRQNGEELIWSSVQDISDRKQAEQLLKASEERWQLAILGSNAGIWDWNLKTNQVFRSARWKEMWGYEEGEVSEVIEEWKNRIHPDDRPLVADALEKHFTHKTPLYQAEYRIQRKDGSILWVLDRGQALWDETDTVIRVLGSVTDINDRKQAEEELRNLSDRLTLAIKSAAIAIWDWDVPDNILIWDDRMYELYGITPDQFTSVYDAWANSLHPDDRPIAETAIQQALLGEKDYDPEFRVIHPDGTIRYIKAYALVQRNEQGEPQHMVGINFDITDRKLAEIQILQTTAQLEASNRELEAFAYSVSHDLRSPLRAIDGFSKALLEDYGDQFDEDGKDYFDRIRSNVSRMGMLIDDLLRLSRVSRSEMHYTIVNLSALVQEQLDDLRTADPQRQVATVIAPGAIVSADATLMRVVLSNLLQNAWKFTSHHDTARIEFGIMQTDIQPIYFVRDDGAGFDMAYAKMLFRVFQRLHNTHEFPGTGIGLATVQRVIHRHGGQVWAEGSVEQGATIYFTVPTTPVQTGANP
jgi:PAS domain S-box-containing protein